MKILNLQTRTLDERRELAIPGDKDQTINFCVDHFIKVALDAIEDHDFFAVALSGGSTPKAIFNRLVLPENQKRFLGKR